MAILEYDYSDKDYQLVASQGEGTLSSQDYVRIIVFEDRRGKYGSDNNVIARMRDLSQAIFYSSLSEHEFNINISAFNTNLDELTLKTVGGNTNDFKIYQNGGDIYIKPNEVLNQYGLVEGNYTLRIDFLNQVKPAGFNASYFYNPTGTWGEDNYNTDTEYLSTLPFPYYKEEFISINPGDSELAASLWYNQAGRPDIGQYLSDLITGADGGPVGEEALETLPSLHYQFIIKEISTSRKEIRLKLLDSNILDDSPMIQMLSDEFNYNTDSYAFKHLLNVGNGNQIPIMNYNFDSISDGKDNQSIILKLYEPLPRTINNLKLVTIEREVLITQDSSVFYFSDEPPGLEGSGLIPDESENWIIPNQNESNELENYNDLTSSISTVSLENIISSSTHNYPNLNTDFRFFENHTFFGSAKRKLVNFKDKVETIQDYYSKISSSLSASGVSVAGDSNQLIKYRLDIFEKVNNEIKSFTPYERFLYFDGQSESTASAPGLGKNYSHTIPVSSDFLDYQGQLNLYDGFDTVYHHSSKDISSHPNINLFTNKYRFEDSPFFNYDSSSYLSFLMKANDGVSLTWDNSYKPTGDSTDPGYYLPEGAFYQNTLSSPTISGSHYQRFIFQSSQSYWVPTANAGVGDYDISSIECWEHPSSELEIISGSIKTGSNAIKDTSGKYQYLTNVVTQSGVPFKGSVLPSGEMFKIYHTNTLSQSLQGYWNVDDVTSGSALPIASVTNDAGPTTGDANISTAATASDGLIHPVTGRQYGSSYYIISASDGTSKSEGIQFESSNFNYSKDDNFSVAIWVKRFHPDTGSADPSNPARDKQEIIMRGSTNDSYGIDYTFQTNAYRVGVRSGSNSYRAQKIMSDDGLNWHHIAFTYESGSTTGIKIYVDGVFEAHNTNIGVGEFSASSPTSGESLTMGQVSTLSGNGDQFSGYLQYPRVYDRTLTQEEVTQLYNSPDGVIESKITDVRVSLKDPTNAQPFSQLYHTSSADWISWYDGMYDSASAFDKDNIHSLENNLPVYIKNSSEYDELKDYLSLQGEHYDIVRNHIDSLGTLHNRGYKKTDSAPENTFPVLLNNIGWNTINPFSGSLSETLGPYLSGVTSIDDIKNNTWRKTLNNLLYVYKTKGTENSVRALLNIYGYPPDVLKLKEFGGVSDYGDNSNIISDLPPSPTSGIVDTDLRNQSGSVGYVAKQEKLYNYMFKSKADRGLELPWWTNNADINTIEFVHKHKRTTNTQTILKSSGSGTEHLWDLRLLPSSDGISSSFEFRLNNSNTGSSAIADNGISMSLDYNIMTDGQLWNVMLQRATASVSGSGTNEYRLHAALQDGPSIQTYNYVTMSVSGGLSNTYVTGGADSNYYANQNWSMTGSRGIADTGSLFVGLDNFSSSISQIKSWTTTLSMSKFRKHVLNKFSTVGNTINSDCQELVYHFKLNENYTTSSISSSTQQEYIIDSAPKTNLTANYSFVLTPTSMITSSCLSPLYGYDIIDTIKLGINSNTQKSENDNNIVINPSHHVVGDLNPLYSISSIVDKPKVKTSTNLELNMSPQDSVNNHILNSLDTANFENYYGNPQYYYSSSYRELDDFRKDFFNCQPILVDMNKFIRAHEHILNTSMTDAIQSSVPARSTLSDRNTTAGVVIKPSILEKQKIVHEKASIETNPNLSSGSLSMVDTGSYQHNFVLSSLLELPLSTSINMGSTYVTESVDGRFITPQFLQLGGYTASLETEKTGSISPLPKFTGSLELPLSTSISMGSTFISESDDNRNIVPPFIQQGGVTASIEFPKSGSIEEITTQYTKEFVNIHDSWGTHESSSHFMNYANKVGNTYDNSHLDMRFANSASAGSTVTLTSIEAGGHVNTGSTSPNLQEITFKTKTYLFVSHSGTANLDYNGAFSADSSSVHVLTGSNSATLGISSSQAGNLLAAITSSNGHGESFNMNVITLGLPQLDHVVNLICKVDGPIGNTLSASFNSSMELAILDGTASPLPFRGGFIGLGDYDDGHIEPRYNFRMIGDTEHYSGSYNNSDNFSNAGNFYNREQITENLQTEIQYESFLTGNPGLQDGRMLGKTRYFYTGSDGNIVLPSNHIDKFSYPFKDRMWQGSKNTSPGFLDTQHEDYATASFYRVKVTGGENEIVVKGNNTPTLDSDDKIIR